MVVEPVVVDARDHHLQNLGVFIEVLCAIFFVVVVVFLTRMVFIFAFTAPSQITIVSRMYFRDCYESVWCL